MIQENKNMIITLVKIKQLHVCEMENKLEKEKDSKIVEIYSNIIQTMKIELTILSRIVKFEERNNGT